MDITLNFFSLFWKADMIIKTVVFLLISLSIYSWSIIFEKYFELKKTRSRTRKLIKQIKSDNSLAGLDYLPDLGLKTILKYISSSQISEAKLNLILDHESDKLSNKLDKLATFSNISPFIGLFGTVWGIMSSFQMMVSGSQNHLSSVAPGIAEALFVTSLGFMVAIPCSFFFNIFSQRIEKIRSSWLEFILSLQI